MLKGEVARMDLGTNHAEVSRGEKRELFGRNGISAVHLPEWRSPCRRGVDEGFGRG